MMWHNGYGWFGGYWLFGIFFWCFGIAAVVALIVMLIRRSMGMGFHRGWYGHEPSALEIAKRRYARGEITKEQFEQLKKDLS